MQLSDTIKDTEAIHEAINETDFMKWLKYLSELPDFKKREYQELFKNQDFKFEDLRGIFNA